MNRTTAVAHRTPGPIDGFAFETVVVDLPDPAPHDLLVEVRAVSVNPVDVKQRAAKSAAGDPVVLGYDAAGVVRAVGSDVTLFAPGDEVFYAGSITRTGTNAGLHLVDERIVGRKPRTLSFTEAAALPLTSLTAWETLVDRLRWGADDDGRLLVMAAAGGVGSMVVQLARVLTGATVVAAGSRPEAATWATSLGAHATVDRRDLAAQVERVAPGGVDAIFSPFSAGNVETYAQVLRPRGAVVAIDEPEGLELLPFKAKSLSWHWELMFTRPLFEPESTAQHTILDTVADLVDAGTVRSTATTTLDALSPATLLEAHRLVETSATIGKVVLPVDLG